MATALAVPVWAASNAGSATKQIAIARAHDRIVVVGTKISCFVERNVDSNRPVGAECGKGFAKGSWAAATYGATIRINDEVELFKIDDFAQLPDTVFQQGQIPWPRIAAGGKGGRIVRLTVGNGFRLEGSHLVCDLRLTDVGAPRTPTLLCQVFANGRPPAAGSWAASISSRLVAAVRFGADQQITSSQAYRQP